MNWFSLFGWCFIMMCISEVLLTSATIQNPLPRKRSAMVLNAAVQVALAVWIVTAIQRGA